jgi:hypothetical protein
MGINEIDHTIYRYTVWREDYKAFPRSFKTLTEARHRTAPQDWAARLTSS